ncbi:MAG: aspartate ammonia-lyase [Methanomicrobiales archaeon]|nr:aspartate ammonia-lyase [Methanomicrobiales archaeon]
MRTERDSLGTREIPDEAWYGVETVRALENFPVSGIRARPEFVRSYVLVKKAAALANMELGALETRKGEAIVRAADEVLGGRLSDQFPVDVFQAGAGTSFHMNVNEVLANRALELLGREKGDYAYLSPHDHVNRSQSTNDTFPTATHLSLMEATDRLLSVLEALISAVNRKAAEFQSVPKSGRTHLMDALPVTLGDEFAAYATALARCAGDIREKRNDLLEVALGSTATGTGAIAPPGYRERVLMHLSHLTSLPLRPARNSFEALQSRSRVAALSAALRGLALELGRIANDLRLLGSGPVSGFADVSLPTVQPGSSIMPGKANPVMAECLNMICFQVIGNDTVVALATQAGQLELNVMTPIMTYDTLESLRYLSNFLPEFQRRCIVGIEAQRNHLIEVLERNSSLVTLLTPRIGYLLAAEIAQEAAEKGTPVPRLVVERGIMTEQEAKEFFDLLPIAQSRYRTPET